MENMNRHLRQWKHNRSFLQSISREYHDWIITASFYTALHAVDTLLASRKDEAQSHSSRNDKLARTNSYSKIYKHDRPLYELSRSIRYLAMPQRWVSYENIEPKVIKGMLYPIEQSVIKLANLNDIDLTPIKLAGV